MESRDQIFVSEEKTKKRMAEMNWLLPVKWLASHFSPASLRANNDLLRDQNAELNAKIIGLELRLKQTENQRDEFKSQVEVLQSELNVARQEIKNLEEVKASIKDQNQLEQRLVAANAAIQNLERQLRIKSIGF